MIIDFHTHAFPDKIASGAIESLSKKASIPAFTNGTVSDTDKKMTEWHIDKRVMLSIATNPKQQHNVNNFAIETNSENIISFASVHPDAPDALSELDRIKSTGLKGVKFHPEYQGFFIDDRKMFSIYDKCRSLGLIMIFHSGLDIGFPGSLKAPPQKSKNLLKNFPGANFVFAHMGGAAMYDEVIENLAGKDCFFDTAFSIVDLPPETAKKIIDKHGAEKILFGSDCPWEASCDSVKYVDSLKISDSAKEMIFEKNAIRLLEL